ncbi:cytochrome c-type biogenesis protein CcmF [Desulfonatronum thiosulfatophilum]|uniref:Cytochrome c-type biogenesis protein CcmF n=1 Tax=Desulfonatronum thiosulfatophilum TaxID=617002 RepID=A0A1G6A966_9BACT|nr:cytochrome c-type biogenesis CcmF C-terminal domain-containing protein [Desulfonatronum thiosulfatophilum]SDB04941.1 cytochrome c-type biogenesis protein CcmF [Desulfonatronum thiosulfatophilum]
MHIIPYFSLLAALLISLLGAAACIYQAWEGRSRLLSWVENSQIVVCTLVTISSLFLFYAFYSRDFSLVYVSRYSDLTLPMFYTLTAFWAGQAGSMLFWAWMVVIFGTVWVFSPKYQGLGSQTKVFFWIFFLGVQTFFMYLLTGVQNPFIEISPAPLDGQGLNPLLQHPGMIIHPPTLFLGYAGFTIPACLALASWIAGEKQSWIQVGHNWTLTSWIFLSMGIILGGWWAYLELGWGGYWAWDPVENASLIPWLSATAFLHTAIVGQGRKALGKTNVLLMVLTLVLCFMATYLVRSGVIDSLHAFGDGGVGTPLMLFMIFSMMLTGLILFFGPSRDNQELSGLLSRQGLLVITAWILLTLGLVVMMGTFWPVISSLWSENPMGLDAGFYNRVCLPLFALIAVILMICPWVQWKEGVRHGKWLAALIGIWVALGVVLWFGGIRMPLALIGASAGLGILVSIVMLFVLEPGLRRRRTAWGAYGVHFGLALMVLGIAVSGPYKTEVDAILSPGESMTIRDYTITYQGMETWSTPAMMVFAARLEISRDGEVIGEIRPQRRSYRTWDRPHAKIATRFSLGEELYATLLGFTEDDIISLRMSTHPLVNWVWIGGTLLCLVGFVALRTSRGVRRETETATA